MSANINLIGDCIMTTQEWVSQLDNHDYKTLATIAASSDTESWKTVYAFVDRCLHLYGGSKEFAVLEYCAHALTPSKNATTIIALF